MWAQGQEAGGIVAAEVLGLVLSPPPCLQGPKQGTNEGGPGVLGAIWPRDLACATQSRAQP